jgi:hypothetical protein
MSFILAVSETVLVIRLDRLSSFAFCAIISCAEKNSRRKVGILLI